ncbi:MAG: hypothetical protein ACXVGI_05720 [Mycobacteriaceae bacterium]
MLILALGAVVVGCLFLVVSFVTENTAWAWGCIGACGLAAVVLVVDTIRRGRAPEGADASPADTKVPTGSEHTAAAEEIEAVSAVAPTESVPLDVADVADVADDSVTAEDDATTSAPDPENTQVLLVAEESDPRASRLEDREPDEEDVDSADALVVGGLSTEVLVVDEHPRFHLPTCTWLADRSTLGLPVAEAVELGFTGCARCAPSTTLAGQSRAR